MSAFSRIATGSCRSFAARAPSASRYFSNAARRPAFTARTSSPAFRNARFYSEGASSKGEASGGGNKFVRPALFVVAAGAAYYLASGFYNDYKPGLDYQEVYNAIADSLEEGADDYDDGSYAPVLLRLAWHASGTYDEATGTGGSNGATMRFGPEAGHGANAGLHVARDKLEPIKKKFPQITYADLWTLAGVAAVQEMGGPKIPWRPGRADAVAAESCPPDGRLPDGDKGADHIRHIFYKMGFNDMEIVALIGAHALGRCHTDRSGFEGPWTFSPTTFTNDFYKLLFDEKWIPRKWNGPPQYQDKSTKSLMMLYTDIALSTDKTFKVYAKKYAQDQDAFFEDFSAAFAKLLELGVPKSQFTSPPKTLKTLDEFNEDQKVKAEMKKIKEEKK